MSTTPETEVWETESVHATQDEAIAAAMQAGYEGDPVTRVDVHAEGCRYAATGLLAHCSCTPLVLHLGARA